jgi:hypothetical protein
MCGQLHAPAPLPRENSPHGTHWTGGWVDPRVGLDDVEKNLDPTGNRTPTTLGRPARNQSLYRLRYMGSGFMKICRVIYIFIQM